MTDLLRRHVEGERPHVDLLVGVDAGHDEEDARPAGSAAEEAAEAEDDDALVLLHDLDGEAEGDGQRDEDEDDGAEGDEVRADAGALVTRCKEGVRDSFTD